MTVEQLRQYPGCEAYTAEEAAEVIRSLEQLAHIVYSIHRQSGAASAGPPEPDVESDQNE